MHHTCFHIVSDHKDQFFNTVQDVKHTIAKWKDEGESNFRIYRITTEEIDSDEIDLEEHQVDLKDTEIN